VDYVADSLASCGSRHDVVGGCAIWRILYVDRGILRIPQDCQWSGIHHKNGRVYGKGVEMCIMEVHAGQKSSTIAQALAHNVSTVERDMDMFEKLVEARGANELLHDLQFAHDHLRKAYAMLLEVFGIEVAIQVQDEKGHVHTHDHGNERSLIEVAHHDAGLARRFETR
jgi:hypothetical protein